MTRAKPPGLWALLMGSRRLCRPREVGKQVRIGLGLFWLQPFLLSLAAFLNSIGIAVGLFEIAELESGLGLCQRPPLGYDFNPFPFPRYFLLFPIRTDSKARFVSHGQRRVLRFASWA